MTALSLVIHITFSNLSELSRKTKIDGPDILNWKFCIVFYDVIYKEYEYEYSS